MVVLDGIGIRLVIVLIGVLADDGLSSSLYWTALG